MWPQAHLTDYPRGGAGSGPPHGPSAQAQCPPGNQHPAAAPRQSRHFVPTCFIYPCLFCFFKKKNLDTFLQENESRSVVSNFLQPHELYTVHGILQARTLEWVLQGILDLPNPRIEPRSPTLRADFLPAKPQGKPKNTEAEL